MLSIHLYTCFLSFQNNCNEENIGLSVSQIHFKVNLCFLYNNYMNVFTTSQQSLQLTISHFFSRTIYKDFVMITLHYFGCIINTHNHFFLFKTVVTSVLAVINYSLESRKRFVLKLVLDLIKAHSYFFEINISILYFHKITLF